MHLVNHLAKIHDLGWRRHVVCTPSITLLDNLDDEE